MTCSGQTCSMKAFPLADKGRPRVDVGDKEQPLTFSKIHVRSYSRSGGGKPCLRADPFCHRRILSRNSRRTVTCSAPPDSV